MGFWDNEGLKLVLRWSCVIWGEVVRSFVNWRCVFVFLEFYFYVVIGSYFRDLVVSIYSYNFWVFKNILIFKESFVLEFFFFDSNDYLMVVILK